jgi:hypothetical protein
MHWVLYLYVQILIGIVECLCKFYQIECSPFRDALLLYSVVIHFVSTHSRVQQSNVIRTLYILLYTQI